MERSMRCLLPALVFLSVTRAVLGEASDPENLIPDASFESAQPLAFTARPTPTCHAEKHLAEGAEHGNWVMAIVGWDHTGSAVRSPALRLEAARYSAGISIRSFGAAEGAKVELLLVDSDGVTRAAFGEAALDGQGAWRRLERMGVALGQPLEAAHLAIRVSGPQRGTRVEIDRVGFFEGDESGMIDGRFDFTWFEAEQLADGKAWNDVAHLPYWYPEHPSGGRFLSGSEAVAEQENRSVSRTVPVSVPGPHKLWWRFHSVNAAQNSGRFTIELRQAGKTVASKEVHDAAEAYPRKYLVWDSISADLQIGEAEVVVSRPSEGVSSIARKLDLFALTDRMDYEPDIADFWPKGYMRFINESAQQEPFCAWMIVRRHRPPWYARPGVLSAEGFSGTVSVPADESKWLAAGDASPWIEMNRYLLPSGGRNNASLLLTRKNHVAGLVQGRIRGKLEFAVGSPRRVVKSITIDQDAPRIIVALPFDFENLAHEIRGADDFIRPKEKMIAGWSSPEGPIAKHLDLAASLSLRHGQDPADLLAREVGILKALGFNNTFEACAKPEDALDFCRDRGLQPYFGISASAAWVMFEDGCPWRPQGERMEAYFKSLAAENQPILRHVNKVRVMDEPGGPPFEHLRGCSNCQRMFVEMLKSEGVTPQQLGADSWPQVVIVTPDDRDSKPALYFHSVMFRLKAEAARERAIVEVKRRHLPDSARTYTNLVPLHSETLTWVARGTDPFLLQREGGLESQWTEDWLAYGAHPRHAATALAMIRAAGRDRQPIGMYVVGEAASPHVLRLKYYLAVAHGARHINVYNYGPWYDGIDAWSEDTALYPIVAGVQRELARIDDALAGTTRRASRVAILYNRTASIWEAPDGASQHDASYLHWALAHDGYDADFIAEEDVEAGGLDRYAVLYMTGAQIRRASAERIAAWVRDGGTLTGTAGAGSRDPYNRSLEVLDPVFGARSAGLELVGPLGRPRFELKSQQPLDEFRADGQGEPRPVAFRQFCYRESLDPLPAARVTLRNRAGVPAGVVNRFGRGVAMRFAGLPGVAYLHAAMDVPGYDAATYVPPKYPEDLRRMISEPCRLANLEPVARSRENALEVVRYDAADRSVIFLIDNLNLHRDVTVHLSDAGRFKRVESAAGSRVKVVPKAGGVLELTLPLNVADALVLRP
jgi:hypothetical protein